MPAHCPARGAPLRPRALGREALSLWRACMRVSEALFCYPSQYASLSMITSSEARPRQIGVTSS